MNTARKAQTNLTEMCPGIYQPGHTNDGPNLPTGPLNTLLDSVVTKFGLISTSRTATAIE